MAMYMIRTIVSFTILKWVCPYSKKPCQDEVYEVKRNGFRLLNIGILNKEIKVRTMTIAIVPRIAASEFLVIADKKTDNAAIVLILNTPNKYAATNRHKTSFAGKTFTLFIKTSRSPEPKTK